MQIGRVTKRIEEKGGYWGKGEGWGAKTAGRREEAMKVSADELGGDGNSTQVPSTAVSSLGCSVSLPNARLLSWFTFTESQQGSRGSLWKPSLTLSLLFLQWLPPHRKQSMRGRVSPNYPACLSSSSGTQSAPASQHPLWSSSAHTW